MSVLDHLMGIPFIADEVISLFGNNDPRDWEPKQDGQTCCACEHEHSCLKCCMCLP